MDRTVTEFLRLVALDTDDLKVISACVQDAVARVGDLEYVPSPGKFIVTMNRFAWEKESAGQVRIHERRRSVLHFDRVLSVARTGFDPDQPDTVLSLLAVTFHPEEDPSGTIELVFAGGAGVRLKVECIEARLADLGGAWATEYKPSHPE